MHQQKKHAIKIALFINSQKAFTCTGKN